MIAIKPHSITFAAVSQAVLSNGVLGNPSLGTGSAPIACLCVPLEPSEAYQLFGAVLLNPWKVFLEVADAEANAAPNASIVFNAQTYWQKGEAQIFGNGDAADCAIVFMSQNQYPLEV